MGPGFSLVWLSSTLRGAGFCIVGMSPRLKQNTKSQVPCPKKMGAPDGAPFIVLIFFAILQGAFTTEYTGPPESLDRCDPCALEYQSVDISGIRRSIAC